MREAVSQVLGTRRLQFPLVVSSAEKPKGEIRSEAGW